MSKFFENDDRAVVRGDEWMGLDGFIWFFGVVEDRDDPLRVGRVRVRCHGWHSADKSRLPTDKLPWAQVVAPVTSASVSGVGVTPTGLVEGSWVVGFFIDGKRTQFPMILGSVHGIPYAASTPSVGFNDPYGAYPKVPGESDVTRLARGHVEAEMHPMLVAKRDSILTDVPTASKHKLSTVSHDQADTEYTTHTWSEPKPRGAGTSLYPFNHVRETESGHVTEIDDTPGCRRTHDYHAAGTFREVIDDGTSITKVVGDDYQIVISNRNVHIHGNCNVTVNGDSRVFVKGNAITEVTGDYHVSIRGDRYTKIDGNDYIEINGARSTNIHNDEYTLVGGRRDVTVGLNDQHNVGKDSNITVGSSLTSIVGGDTSFTTTGRTNLVSKNTIDVAALNGDINVATTSKLNVRSVGNMRFAAPRIDLN